MVFCVWIGGGVVVGGGGVDVELWVALNCRWW